MSKTFAMPVNAKKGFLMLAEEMISLAAPGLPGIDDLKSAVAKVEASLSTEEITLSNEEMIAMMTLGECSDLLQASLRLKKAQEALEVPVDEMPELSQEQVVSYAGIILMSAPEGQKEYPVYKATMSLLQTVAGHPGGDCGLSPEEHHAYMAIKRMYYAGSFGKE